MTRNELFKELNNGVLRSIYMFYGAEKYLVNKAIDNIKCILEKDLGETLDYILLEGSNTNGNEICELCSSVSFVSSRKLIVVDDYLPLINKDSKAEESILSYIDEPYDDILIFKCTNDPVKTSAIYKKLTGKTCAVDFAPLTEPELSAFITNECARYNKKISREAISFFIQYADMELNTVINEINKLALCVDEKVISADDIESAVTPSREYKIFKLTDYVFDGNKKDAVELIDLLLSQKEEAVFILAVLAKNFHYCNVADSMKKDGKSIQDICKALGIRDFVANKILKYCSKMTKGRLNKCNELLLQADTDLKSSAVTEKVCLTQLIILLIDNINKR